MARLRIISLSHRATWLDVKCDEALEKISSLNEGSLCWLKLNGDRSKLRRGIYKVTKLKKQNFVAAHLVTEHQITEEYKSLEKILQEEGCLPEGVNVPIGVPKASKTILIFDLVRGLCYAFYPGVISPFENIQACLCLLEKETGIPVTAARLFYYDKCIVDRIIPVASNLGYKPYLSKADLDTVKITAEGDLDLNDDWKLFEESIKENKKWLTIGYRRSTDNYNELFKLYNRKRSSDISILQTEELSYDNIVERIINVQSILETALGKEVCDCCFPESITTTLSQFNE